MGRASADRVHASFVRQMLRASGTHDIADAHAAIVARQRGDSLVTSDPDDLSRLNPGLNLIAI